MRGERARLTVGHEHDVVQRQRGQVQRQLQRHAPTRRERAKVHSRLQAGRERGQR
jgi:hypothetical protein